MAFEIAVNESKCVGRIDGQVLVIRGDKRACLLKTAENTLDKLPLVKARLLRGKRRELHAVASQTNGELAPTSSRQNLLALQGMAISQKTVC